MTMRAASLTALLALALVAAACTSSGSNGMTGGGGAGGHSTGGRSGTGGAGGSTGGAAGQGDSGGRGGAVDGSSQAGTNGADAAAGGGGTSVDGGGRGGGGGQGTGGSQGSDGGGPNELLPVAAMLNSSSGFKMVAPCGAIASTMRSCDHNPKSNCGNGLVTFLRTDKTIGGTKGTFYNVTLHFRGIIEANQYAGGTSDHNGFYVGGQVSNADGMAGGQEFNQYVLELSSPKTTYHLNNIDESQRAMYRVGNPSGSGVHHFGFIIDYHETIKLEGQSTVSLYALDSDCAFGRNCKPPSDDFGHCEMQTLPDIPSDIRQPYDGNFIWIDVENVTLAQ